MPPLNHYTYDAGNRLLDDGIQLYAYDNKGNLTSKTNKTTAQYAYDPFGRRIEKNVNGIVTKYLYDRDAILLEYDQDGNVVRSYTHGLRIDEPLMVSSESGSYYYHTDALGSITSITDSAGAVVQQTVYDAYGKIQSGNTLPQPYAYTGREYDAETGLYYYRARYYDPTVGRFLSPDPIGLAGGINLYSYVKNNPVNYIDPTGLVIDSLRARVTILVSQGEIAEAIALAEAGGLAYVTKLTQLQNQLNYLTNQYPPNSFKCDTLAEKIYDAFKAIGANPQILRIKDAANASRFFTDKGVQFANSGFHQFVKVGDKVFDAITGPAGMPYSQYIEKLQSYQIYTTNPTIIK